ncbi:Hypothetical protein, putative [Bodo saltans]|uniref:DNA repair metallo-beta-lactamase domain-containing protein n=1 Tax=Bodo saltans TaxID=75058 RepID=A0A0S4IPE0_BODSA|nr:Hypothetical protein, putative [Bodo saltans]|eukprot:CUE94847.1 Hypothetical protein, putative [Bodo saltans]
MKLPFLPLVFDSFTHSHSHCSHDASNLTTDLSTSSTTASSNSLRTSFFLSHFHTDHLKGLHSSWGIGYHPHQRTIYCSRITRALILAEYGEGLAAHVVALPLYQWFDIPVTSSYAVRCCLLPACHIPGSVQFLLETFLGRILYTGDLKVTPHLLRLMAAVQDVAPVDHLFLDDTWLHLDRVHGPLGPSTLGEELLRKKRQRDEDNDEVTSDGGGSLLRTSHQSRVVVPHHHHHRQAPATLNKMLNEEQLNEAMEAIRRRTVPMCHTYTAARTSRQQLQQQQQQHASSVATVEQQLLEEAVQDIMWRPYVLRVYLHNHFGKEGLLQRLAMKLGTTVLIDDDRYRLLAAVAATNAPLLSSGGHSQRRTDDDEMYVLRSAREFFFSIPADGTEHKRRRPTTEVEERLLMDDVLRCREMDAIDLRYFIPHSQLRIQCQTWAGGDAGGEYGPLLKSSIPAALLGSPQQQHRFYCDAQEEDHALREDQNSTSNLNVTAPTTAAAAAASLRITISSRVAKYCGRAAGGGDSDVMPAWEGSDDDVRVTNSNVVPCIEVVRHRRHISRSALSDASLAAASGDDVSMATPHFGMIMTGWAKMNKRELSGEDRLWQLPYTMHSTPTELGDLVAILKPASVVPIHYDRERGALVASRLGGLLRTPYVNAVISASAVLSSSANYQVPLSLREYLFGEAYLQRGETMPPPRQLSQRHTNVVQRALASAAAAASSCGGVGCRIISATTASANDDDSGDNKLIEDNNNNNNNITLTQTSHTHRRRTECVNKRAALMPVTLEQTKSVVSCTLSQLAESLTWSDDDIDDQEEEEQCRVSITQEQPPPVVMSKSCPSKGDLSSQVVVSLTQMACRPTTSPPTPPSSSKLTSSTLLLFHHRQSSSATAKSI